MKEKTKTALNILGFTNLTGNLYQHENIKIIIQVDDNCNPDDLVNKILRIGALEQQALIQVAIGLKVQ